MKIQDVKCRYDVRSISKTARSNVVWPYGIAILAIALALGLKLALASELSGEASYLFFLPAALIASALGGMGPGLLATALGLCLGLYFVAEYAWIATSEIINADSFALVGVGVALARRMLSQFPHVGGIERRQKQMRAPRICNRSSIASLRP